MKEPWYLQHRRPAKAQARLRIRAVSPEPLLFAHIKYGSRRRIRQKIRHLAPLDGCACRFEEWVYGGRKKTIITWAGSFIGYYDALWSLSRFGSKHCKQRIHSVFLWDCSCCACLSRMCVCAGFLYLREDTKTLECKKPTSWTPRGQPETEHQALTNLIEGF